MGLLGYFHGSSYNGTESTNETAQFIAQYFQAQLKVEVKQITHSEIVKKCHELSQELASERESTQQALQTSQT